MRIALAQINPTLGDFSGNRKKIIEFVNQSLEQKAHLIVFPELSLFGYEPFDLLERLSVVEAQLKELKKLEGQLKKCLPKDVAVIVGAVTLSPKGKPFFNSAIVIQKQKKSQVCSKNLLPNYDIFDERRHFETGRLDKNVFQFHGKKILVSICEDMWGWSYPGQKPWARYRKNPMAEIPRSQLDLVISINASPFSKNKSKTRSFLAKKIARHFSRHVVYVNLVGGQDEIIFDGGSFVMNPKGDLLAQAQKFYEQLLIVDLKSDRAKIRTAMRPFDELQAALILGLRDFAHKVGITKVHLGLSGGIDSALVAVLAVHALGHDNVTGLALPGPFSAPESLIYAQQLAKNLQISLKEVSINNLYETTLHNLKQAFGSWSFGVAHENLQARLRAIILMAFANHDESLLLSTSNKSELATGYSTLYGDMCGALAPIGDLVKEDVYALANHLNSRVELIPQKIIDRAPTAELRYNQKDQDSLPAYPLLDRSVKNLVEHQQAARSPLDKQVLQLMYRSEFKRWQSPPILRISEHAFGRGRRFPIANRTRD